MINILKKHKFILILRQKLFFCTTLQHLIEIGNYWILFPMNHLCTIFVKEILGDDRGMQDFFESLYYIECCAEVGKEYDPKFPWLSSEDSSTGDDSEGTGRHHKAVPRIGYPSGHKFPQLVFSLDLLTLSIWLESGMCQMSEVITRMSEMALSDQGSQGTSQGRTVIPDIDLSPSGDPLYPEFYGFNDPV